MGVCRKKNTQTFQISVDANYVVRCFFASEYRGSNAFVVEFQTRMQQDARLRIAPKSAQSITHLQLFCVNNFNESLRSSFGIELSVVCCVVLVHHDLRHLCCRQSCHICERHEGTGIRHVVVTDTQTLTYSHMRTFARARARHDSIAAAVWASCAAVFFDVADVVLCRLRCFAHTNARLEGRWILFIST